MMYFRPDHIVVGGHVLRRLALGALDTCRFHPARQRRHDSLSNLVLKCENIFQLAVVTFGPHVIPSRGIDKLYRDADSISGLADTSLDDILDAKFLADFLDLHRPTQISPLIKSAPSDSLVP